MEAPFFSIVIPTYNRGPELVANINSILKQSFNNFELIVVDDGSQDNTEQLLSEIFNPKFGYYKTKNNERSYARNFGVRQSKGVYINFFDSDDIMYLDRLQQVFEWIHNNNEPDVFFTHYDFVDGAGKSIGQTERFYKSFTKDILFNNFLATGSVFLKREIAMQYPFHEDRKIITAEDWELWLRIHAHYDFHECPLKTFAIMQHDGRSLRTISPERVKERDLYFIEVVKHNADLRKKYSKMLNLFIADRYTFIALTLAENKQRANALNYLLRSFKSSLNVLKRKRFWASTKKIVWP